jgi:predicted nucleotidyltransferase
MNKTEILNKLKELKPILSDRYGINKFAIFGSVAKGIATDKSDIDIAIIDMQIKDAFGLFYAKDFLKEELKRDVDIGTFSSMKTFIKNRIKKDFIYV